MSINTVVYNGENLYGYKMLPDEAKILESLREELLLMANELKLSKGQTHDGRVYEGRFQDNPDYSIRYKKEYGYFLIQGERGNYRFLSGTPTKDRNRAKYLIMKQQIIWSSTSYECKRREELKSLWRQRYDCKYDSRKAWMEYAIAKIYEGFQIIDDELISSYTEYLNNRYEEPFWRYDYRLMSFLQIRDDREFG